MASASQGFGVALTHGWITSARAVPEQQLAITINFARITLIVGLVFLHYESFPNVGVSPFRGLAIGSPHPIAFFINSFVLFFFFAVVPLLSMISGWLFFSFTGEPWAALRRRIG